jgi:hypothetical protein
MKVQDILTDESKWIKGDNAESKTGKSVKPESRFACRFCLYGAIWRVKHLDPVFDANKALEKISRRIGNRNHVTHWNDQPSRTFKQIRGLIEELDL